MLKRHAQLFVSFLMLADLLAAAGLWWGLYALLFDTRWLDPLVVLVAGAKKPPHPRALHIEALPFVLFGVHVALRACGTYRPRRERQLAGEVLDIAKAGGLAFLLILAFQNFFQHEASFSRAFHLLFLASLVAALSVLHLTARAVLRRLRERGWNQRHVLVCGAGSLGRRVAHAIHEHRWTGLTVRGFLDDDPALAGTVVDGVPVLGTLADVHATIAEKGIDQVIAAIPFSENGKLPGLLTTLTTETVDVRIVPDLAGFGALNMSISDLDGLPLVSLRESPLIGWSRVAKRAVDVLVSVAVLAAAAVPMLLIALAIKLTSRGPVFYTQERMGLDGRTFRMLKFRTMRADAEAQTGAVWATENDPRRTRLGTFLRKTSLDELPQFLNVLAGQMSVVGPRPERPVFIQDFKRKIPQYMLRHKVKAGITGWAQVNGWRGNTSLDKRIEYDLYYIEHWSIGFDLWIIALTPFKGLVSKNAY